MTKEGNKKESKRRSSKINGKSQRFSFFAAMWSTSFHTCGALQCRCSESLWHGVVGFLIIRARWDDSHDACHASPDTIHQVIIKHRTASTAACYSNGTSSRIDERIKTPTVDFHWQENVFLFVRFVDFIFLFFLHCEFSRRTRDVTEKRLGNIANDMETWDKAEDKTKPDMLATLRKRIISLVIENSKASCG